MTKIKDALKAVGFALLLWLVSMIVVAVLYKVNETASTIVFVLGFTIIPIVPGVLLYKKLVKKDAEKIAAEKEALKQSIQSTKADAVDKLAKEKENWQHSVQNAKDEYAANKEAKENAKEANRIEQQNRIAEAKKKELELQTANAEAEQKLADAERKKAEAEREKAAHEAEQKKLKAEAEKKKADAEKAKAEADKAKADANLKKLEEEHQRLVNGKYLPDKCPFCNEIIPSGFTGSRCPTCNGRLI